MFNLNLSKGTQDLTVTRGTRWENIFNNKIYIGDLASTKM